MKRLIVLIIVLTLVAGCMPKISPESTPKPVPTQVSQPQIEGCGNQVCSKYHECINDECMLKSSKYKIGVVYIYYDQDTYNSNWKIKIKELLNKAVSSLKTLTNNKIDASYDIFGEVQVNTFCWNPAIIGFTLKEKVTILGKEIEDILYKPLPGSSFRNSATGYYPYYKDEQTESNVEMIKNTCKNCIITRTRDDPNYKENTISIACANNLADTSKVYQLEQELIQKLRFNIDNYDIILIIFGKVGTVLPIDKESIKYRCSTVSSVIGGQFFSPNIIIAGENSLLAGGTIDCLAKGLIEGFPKIQEYYGWHIIVHEILHLLGAKDHYETYLTFGLTSHPEEARKYDSKANECVMSNELKPCLEDYSCTDKDLEEIYLCEWDKMNIGLT